jgi:hypothetical protein
MPLSEITAGSKSFRSVRDEQLVKHDLGAA